MLSKEGGGVMAQHMRGKNSAHLKLQKTAPTSNYTQIARLIFSAHTVKMLVKARRSTLGTPSVKGALALNIPLLVIIAYFHGILARLLNCRFSL